MHPTSSTHTHAAAILFAFSEIKRDWFFVTLSRICVSFTASKSQIDISCLVLSFKFGIYKEFSTSSTFLSGSDIFSWDFKKSSRIGYDSLFLRPVDDIRSILGEDQGRRQLSVKHEDVSWPDSLHMPSSSQHHIATRLPTLLSRQQRKKLDPTTYPTRYSRSRPNGGFPVNTRQMAEKIFMHAWQFDSIWRSHRVTWSARS